MFTQRSFFGPIYQDFRPLTETIETPESYLVFVYLPPGFAREHISATFESLNRTVRVFGERPLGSNRWSRFSVVYSVPESCEANKLNRKFEAGIVTITMPKKAISKEIRPKQAAPKSRSYASENESKASGRVEEGKASSSEVKGQKGKEVISQEPKSKVSDEDKVEAALPTEATTGDSFVAQKGQEGVPKKSQLKMDKKIQTDKIERLKMDKKIQTDEIDENGQENGEKQRAEKKETKVDIERTFKKAQEVIPPRPTTRVEQGREVKAQEGQGGKNEKLAGSNLEDGKSRGAEKKETKEVMGKTSEVIGEPTYISLRDESAWRAKIGEVHAEEGKGKPTPDVIDLLAEKESKKEERKECTKKESNSRFGNFEEGGSKGLKDIINYPKGKAMKEVAASASQAVTSMAKRFNEKEDNKQMMIYMGAAAAVVLLTAVIGACASTFRSFTRP